MSYDTSDFEGEGSTERLQKDKQCRHCKKVGNVFYYGSDVNHGNIFAATSDTEVTHYYMCRACGKEWEEYA